MAGYMDIKKGKKKKLYYHGGKTAMKYKKPKGYGAAELKQYD